MNLSFKSIPKTATLMGAGLLALSLSFPAFAQSNGQKRTIILPKPPQTSGSNTNSNARPNTGQNFDQNSAPATRTTNQPIIPKLPSRSNNSQSQNSSANPAPPVQQQQQQPSPQQTFQQPAFQQQSPQDVQHEVVKIFSGTPIDTVLVNGRAADGERVSDTIVNIFIKGDASGISCTNVFDISFVNAAPTRLTANHCHGTTEFAVAPGQVLDMQEVHDGDLDEMSSGIETASSDFKWSYFADAKMSALQFSVPETDNVLLFAECNRGDKFAIVYPLFAPSSLQLNETVQLSLVIDGERADKYEMVVRHFPYLEKPLVPGLRVSSSQAFFKKLAAGQLADFYVTTNAGIQTSLRIRLKGSAKPVRSFAAACSQR